jgi:hypothetical protein
LSSRSETSDFAGRHQPFRRAEEIFAERRDVGMVDGLVGLFAQPVSDPVGAREGVSTNSIESVWAVMKRGLHGVYHHASEKHLHRYVDEFTFRLNEGNVSRHTLDRLESFVVNVAGKRLTYKALIK